MVARNFVEQTEKLITDQSIDPKLSGGIVKKLLAIATTPESAQYFATRMKKHELADTIQTFANGISAQYGTSGSHWTGVPGATDFQKFQESLGAASAQKIQESIKGEIRFSFALSEMSDFLRGSSSEGQQLPPEIMDAMDKLFNSWLVKNNMMSQDSAIYAANTQGVISTDNTGQRIKAVKAHIQELINDPVKGFSLFAKEKGVSLYTKESAYPEKKSEAVESEEAAATSDEAAAAAAEATAPEVSNESDTTRGGRTSMRFGMGSGEDEDGGAGGGGGGGDSGGGE